MKISSASDVVSGASKGFTSIQLNGKSTSLGASNCPGMKKVQTANQELVTNVNQFINGLQKVVVQFNAVDAKKQADDRQDKGSFGL